MSANPAVRRPAPPPPSSSVPSKRRKRLNNFPETFDLPGPDCRVLTHLRSLERKIDACHARKTAEIHEALSVPTGPPTRSVKYRLFLSTEALPPSGESPASWTLSLLGKALEDSSEVKPFSTVLKSLIIQLDPRHYPGSSGIFQWEKQFSPGVSEGFQLRRPGSQALQARIFLNLDFSPMRLNATPLLARLVGVQLETFHKHFTALFALAQSRGLQDAQEPKIVNVQNDKEFAFLFGDSPLTISELASALRQHLRDPDPIVLPYWIRPDGPGQQAFDLTVPIMFEPSNFAQSRSPFGLSFPAPSKEFVPLNAQNNSLNLQYRSSKQKFDFLTAFAASPIASINRLISSQSGEFSGANNPPGFVQETLRHSLALNRAEWLYDAVDRWQEAQMNANNQTAKVE